MKAEDFFNDVTYIDDIHSKRQTYFIYKTKKNYLVLSFKNETYGYVNLVDFKLIESIRLKFKGQKGITSADIFNYIKSKSYHRYFEQKRNVLPVLYTLTAVGAAVIDKRFRGNQLYFNLK
jgi:hypothetical protein